MVPSHPAGDSWTAGLAGSFGGWQVRYKMTPAGALCVSVFLVEIQAKMCGSVYLTKALTLTKQTRNVINCRHCRQELTQQISAWSVLNYRLLTNKLTNKVTKICGLKLNLLGRGTDWRCSSMWISVHHLLDASVDNQSRDLMACINAILALVALKSLQQGLWLEMRWLQL